MTSAQSLRTISDLLNLREDGSRYELHKGELVQMAPPGAEHGRVAAQVVFQLMQYVSAHRVGVVLSNDPGVVLSRNPDTVRAPDVCFLAQQRIPAGGLPKGYLEIAPDLVVEVVSPNDTAAEVQEKIEAWLVAGVKLVWIVYPGTRSVTVYRSLAAARVLTESEALDGEPVLPGLSCPVSTLFA